MPNARADRVSLGILLMVAFTITAPFLDSFAKLATDTVPIGQIVAARFVVQAVLLLPLAAFLGWLHRPTAREVGLHFARASLILLSTFLIVRAFAEMPIADAVAIFFVEPFLLTLAGAFFLGETLGIRRVLACGVGFLGTLLVIQPNFANSGWVALLPLGTAACFTAYLLLTRRMATAMHPVSLQAYTALAASALILPVLTGFEGTGQDLLDPVWPTWTDGLLLLGVGVAGGIAHLFLSFAFSHAPAATLAPLQYLEILFATLLGFLIFADLPNPTAFTGMLLITGSGVYIWWRERKLERLAEIPPAALP
jgi:drug/metabolite transporter (DMT)-like permease